MSPLLALLITAPAWAWPADGDWLSVELGGAAIEDGAGDQGAAHGSQDLFGAADDPALRWFADPAVAQLRIQVADDPMQGPDLRDQVWAVLFELDGDDVLDAALAAHGTTGTLTTYTLDGSAGLVPAGWTAVADVGDLASGAVRVASSASGTWFVDLELSRDALRAVGLDDATPVAAIAVTGSAIGLPWTDGAPCAGACATVADGLPDPLWVDLDGDGATAPEEALLGTVADDADSDDDGLLDGQEAMADTDGDGAVDGLDCDSDGDGILDGTESGLFLAQLSPDTDTGAGCWVRDLDTASPPTDPRDADTDGGGLGDGVEDWNHNGRIDAWETDPTDPVDDVDTDGDGIADVLELLGSDGSVDDADSDGDGIDDAAEGLADPDQDGLPCFLDPDSDGDGIEDSAEGRLDPDSDGLPSYLDGDSDGDGVGDAFEGSWDYDGDGIANFLDLDSDNDTIPDGIDGTEDTDGGGSPNLWDTDSDNDGIGDVVEGYDDVDGDDVPNFQDLNSDGTGAEDRFEGTTDIDCDGVMNFLDPDDESDFCDEGQSSPEVLGGGAPPGSRDGPKAGAGQFTGGSCSTAPGSAGWLALLLVLLLYRAAPAQAQEVNAQRFAPVVDGGRLVKTVDADPGASGTGGVGIWMNRADEPLVFRAADGGEIAMLGAVDTTDVVGSATAGPLRIGLDVPVHLRLFGLDLDPGPRLGDLRLSTELGARIGEPLHLGLFVDGSLPTGSTDHWVGAGAAGLRGGLAASVELGAVLVALNLGGRTGTGSSMGQLRVSPALTSALGLSLAMSDELSAALELDREDWLGNEGERGAHPSEWLLTLRASSGLAMFSIGGGGGMTAGVGSPDYRLVSGLVIALGSPPPSDADE